MSYSASVVRLALILLSAGIGTSAFAVENHLLNPGAEQGKGELPSVWFAFALLHHFQGLTIRETALVLEQPEGTVKWRHKKALEKLRILLRNQEIC